MDTRWHLYSLAPILFLTLGLPAQQQPAAPRKLERLPLSEAQRDDVRPTPPSAEEWKQKLADADLERREQAYTDLIENARNDRELRSALEGWAASKNAPELAWTARLALRELRNVAPGRNRGPAAALRPGRGLDDLRSRFDELERHFGGMDSTFEDLRARMDEMLRNQSQPLQPQQPPAAGSSESFQGYKLQVGPDGVALEATEKDASGKLETKTYKAKDMDELLQNYPELREHIGADMHFDLQGAPGQNWLFLNNGLPDSDWLRNARPSKEPPTDVLGIYSQKLGAERAKDLGLQPEQGLLIERIEPGTIAQVLGLRSGDTLVELNGRAIYGTDDVRQALKERKPAEDVVVTLIGNGEKDRRTLRWSPSTPQPGSDKPRKL